MDGRHLPQVLHSVAAAPELRAATASTARVTSRTVSPFSNVERERPTELHGTEGSSPRRQELHLQHTSRTWRGAVRRAVPPDFRISYMDVAPPILRRGLAQPHNFGQCFQWLAAQGDVAPELVGRLLGCVERREEQDEAVDRQAHRQPADQQHRLRDRRGPAVGVNAA